MTTPQTEPTPLPQDFDELLQRLNQWADEGARYSFAADAAKAIRELRHDAARFFVANGDLERESARQQDQHIDTLSQLANAIKNWGREQTRREATEQQLAEAQREVVGLRKQRNQLVEREIARAGWRGGNEHTEAGK